jgi:hypothetical protein
MTAHNIHTTALKTPLLIRRMSEYGSFRYSFLPCIIYILCGHKDRRAL